MQPPEILMNFEDSADSLQDQCLNSPGSCDKQLRMVKQLQAAGHLRNPMISGAKFPRSTSTTPTNDISTILNSTPEIFWKPLSPLEGSSTIFE